MMADIPGMQKRLKAVLSYDGIVENEMHLHIAKVMNVSKSVAKRMLNGNHRTILSRGIDACDVYSVSVDWLYFGRLDRYDNLEKHNRTMRIHVQAYKGYPKEITDKAMRFNFALIAGLARAKNLMSLVEAKKMNYAEAVIAF